ERLRLAQQVARIGTFEWDIATDKNHWAPELEALYGLPKGSFKGTLGDWLERIHPEDREEAKRRMQEALEKGGFEWEWRVVWPDASVHWLAGRGQVFRDAAGRPMRMLGINIDITDRKRMEQEFQRATENALAANAAKDRFLAILSHELRTPLTPVLMTISAREADTELKAELREELAMVRRNLELEARLIDDLLDLNRIARGKIALRLQPTDLHNTLRNVMAICREEMEAKGLSVHLDLAAPQHNVNGDSGRLQQVFWNLLKNSTKFTPTGGSVTVRTSNPRPGTVRTEVADTGMGIPPEVIPTLFVPFEQGETRAAGHLGGLGLGLAICKAVVDRHGGSIWVESEGEGKGAIFFVELPFTRVPVPLEPGVPEQQTAQWNPRINGRNMRILLVEDNEDTMRILSRLLERAGCEITPARTLRAALEKARALRERGEHFDLLISDLGLPDGDGRDLMRALRDRDGLPGIAISGYGMETDLEKSRAAGFSEHLIKPVQIKELQAAISRLRSRLQDQAPPK
ncbi:MAG: ATP-binding protein, partial [Verrucomicrobia bacterium]|nr:ATP-binding protein [Verrucomicrobiota bacterium]